MFPWLPVGLFFEHEIDAGGFLATSGVPVAILAGERDAIIRPARTDALRQKAKNLVFDATIAGAGHNDIYERPEFVTGMREALAKVVAESKQSRSLTE